VKLVRALFPLSALALSACQLLAGIDEIQLVDGGADASSDAAIDVTSADASTDVTSDAFTSDASTDVASNDAPNDTSADASPTWARGVGGAAGDDAFRALDTDANGNLVVAGNVYGTASIDFGGTSPMGAGSADVSVAKYTRSGALAWAKVFGDTADQFAHAAAFDAHGDVIVAGQMYAAGLGFGFGCSNTLKATDGWDAFVAKLDGTNGSCKWSHVYNATGDQDAFAIAVDANGDVIVTGNTSGAVDFGLGAIPYAGSNDIFVVKLAASSGNTLWSAGYGGTGDDRVLGVALDATGDPFIGGFFSNNVTFGSNMVSSVGGLDAYMAKLDATSGAAIWARGYGSSGDDSAPVPAFDKTTGALYFAGTHTEALDVGGGLMPQSMSGRYDVFVTKRDASNGGHVWSASVGVAGYDMYAEALAIDAAGNPVVAGRYAGTLSFAGSSYPYRGGEDFYIASFDKTTHAQLAAKAYGGPGIDGIGTHALRIDRAGNVTIAGYFEQAIDIGGVMLTSNGHQDAFLASLGSPIP
jgi:hypothetical protein